MTSATAGPGDGPVEVVLHAERLVAGVERRPRERVVVRREVVTEQVQLTVAVRREVLRVVREPLDGAGAGAASGPAGRRPAEEQVVELVLREERPRVELDVVPVERVRVSVERVAGREAVTAEVGHEVLDLDVGAGEGAGRTDHAGRTEGVGGARG